MLLFANVSHYEIVFEDCVFHFKANMKFSNIVNRAVLANLIDFSAANHKSLDLFLDYTKYLRQLHRIRGCGCGYG